MQKRLSFFPKSAKLLLSICFGVKSTLAGKNINNQNTLAKKWTN
jgi:hypothetical protein